MISILYMDDKASDIALIKAALSLGNQSYGLIVIDDLTEARAALGHEIDIILCEFRLASFSGRHMLQLAQDNFPSIPFVFISSELGDEHVMELISMGATDVVNKANLHKLTYVIDRAYKSRQSELALKHLNAELQLKNALLDSILHTLKNQIIYADAGGRVQFVNTAVGKFSDREVAAMLHINLKDFFEIMNLPEKQLQSMIDNSAENELIEVIREGDIYYLEITSTEVTNGDEKLGNLLVIKDVTPRIALEEELEQERMLLNQSELMTNSGSFEYYPDTRELKVSRYFRMVLCRQESYPLKFISLLRRIHPEDRKLYWKALRSLKYHRDSIEVEHRYLLDSNQNGFRYCKSILNLHIVNGKPKYSGIIQDNTESRQTSLAVLNMMEVEINNIARELHDNVGQMLSAASIFLSRRTEGADVVKQLVDDSLSEIRSLNRRLSGAKAVEENHLEHALETLVGNLPIRDIIRLKYRRGTHRMQSFVSGQLYRIIQEALNNCMKYSQASQIVLDIEESEGFVQVKILDDGVGFDLHKAVYGNGIRNIKERVRSCNGLIRINSHQGFGTHIFIDIPISYE